MTTLETKFGTADAADLAGFDTTTMVNYLCREGIITPSVDHPKRRGKKLLFSFKDVVLLKIVCCLLEKGLTVKKIKDALNKTQNLGSLTVDKEGIKYNSEVIKYFLTDGEKVYFVREIGETLTNLTENGQLEFGFMLNIINLHNELINNPKIKKISLEKPQFQDYEPKRA